jgi:hypothetical protein
VPKKGRAFGLPDVFPRTLEKLNPQKSKPKTLVSGSKFSFHNGVGIFEVAVFGKSVRKC